MDRAEVAEIRKVLYLKGKNYRIMADEIGVSYGYLRLVMIGRENGKNTVRKIREYIRQLEGEETEEA